MRNVYGGVSAMSQAVFGVKSSSENIRNGAGRRFPTADVTDYEIFVNAVHVLGVKANPFCHRSG